MKVRRKDGDRSRRSNILLNIPKEYARGKRGRVPPLGLLAPRIGEVRTTIYTLSKEITIPEAPQTAEIMNYP